MDIASPEETLLQILNQVCQCPDGELTDEMKRAIQACLGNRLAEDFDYSDLFIARLLMCHPAQPPTPPLSLSQIPPAVIINDDAYIYKYDTLYALHREGGFWKLQISLYMCYGCFGDHSFTSGTCWGVLCQCCGGTGWDGGDLDYCAGQALPNDLAVCVANHSPRVAFLRLLETDLDLLSPVKAEAALDVSRALVRGQRAKLEIISSKSRYVALLEQDTPGVWCLTAFLELCQVCGGHGRNPDDPNRPCPRCGGTKWGNPGDLRYCRNYAPGWLQSQD